MQKIIEIIYITIFYLYENWLKIAEFTAAITGILSVYFSAKRNIWVYPIGIFSTSIYTFIYFKFYLLANMIINAIFTIISIYGWINWSKDNNNNIVEVTYLKRKQKFQFCILFMIIMLVFFIIHWGISFKFGILANQWRIGLDVVSSSIFLMAMILMSIKKVENWYFWIAGNVIILPLMAYHMLYFSGFQYVVFLALAAWGWVEWKKSIEKKPI